MPKIVNYEAKKNLIMDKAVESFLEKGEIRSLSAKSMAFTLFALTESFLL